MDRSQFFPLFAAAAAKYGFPEQLLIAQCDQESNFDPTCESPTGALGLMQIEPATAPDLTREQLLDPAINVDRGAAILKDNWNIFQRESGDERLKFALAAYNGGPGYIVAAQALCARNAGDSSQWGQVAPYIGAAVVNGKRPDAGQITQYVQIIWGTYQKLLAAENAALPAAPEGAND